VNFTHHCLSLRFSRASICILLWFFVNNNFWAARTACINRPFPKCFYPLSYNEVLYTRGGSGVDRVASHPPLWDHFNLKLRKGTKLSLKRFCLGLFRYRSVRSANPPPPPFPWTLHTGLFSYKSEFSLISHANKAFIWKAMHQASLRKKRTKVFINSNNFQT